MKFFKITAFSFFALAVCGSLRAQDLRGVVRDADNQPLIGASVYWAGTTIGASTDAQGAFLLHRVKGYDRLVASYLGFVNDTLDVKSGVDKVAFALRSEGVALEGVVVEGNLSGNFVKRDGIVKGEMISFAGLCKMACCNLAESFENSASVTVGYSDAISGARQIKMLGLAGTYTQILDENRPIMRGLSAPYGLSYTPGMWLNSIQVSKGVASVTAGHEAITGQINLEHRKPTDDERLFVNLYLDDELRPEANISTAFPVTKDKKLSSVILLHGSMDTDARKMDHNHDGFRDLPKADQINVANKWLYAADNGAQIRWGWKFVQENRLGGMLDYKDTKAMREDMEKNWDWRAGDKKMPLYGSHIRNRNANGYFKVGMPVGPAVYDPDEQDEMRSNLAFVADFDHFSEDAYFGLNDYTGNQNSLALNLMYNHYFTYRSSLIVGVQGASGLLPREAPQSHAVDRRQQRPRLRFRPQRARGGSLCRVYLRHQGQVFGRGRTSRRLQSLLRPLLPHAPRPPEMEHHPLDDAPRLGGPGLPFDERHYGQHRRPGHGPGDHVPRQ